jgi:hypothetical protein
MKVRKTKMIKVIELAESYNAVIKKVFLHLEVRIDKVNARGRKDETLKVMARENQK